MNDKDIIKALECCNSTDSDCLNKCPYFNYTAKCSQAMIKDTLDLINRQQAEIKKLQEHIQKCDTVEQRADELIAQLQKELKTAKSEAVKEFAERLKEKFRDVARIDYNGKPMFIVGDAFVDNLVKEMGGDDK